MSIQSYLEPHAYRLLLAAQIAHDEKGRGALVIFPQEPGEHAGRADVKYHPLASLQEDADPAVPLVEVYDPTQDCVIIVCMTTPQAIYTYTTNGKTLTEISVDGFLIANSAFAGTL